MAIKVLIKRRLPEELEGREFNLLVRKLRALATAQQGYISGETLKRLDQPNQYLVISMWLDMPSWQAWQANPERKLLQEKIDLYLGTPTDYEIYENA